MNVNIVAVSGGKDSTAMALRLMEVEPDTPKRFICTPTGDELPAMVKHYAKVEKLIGCEIERLPAPTLDELIEEWGAVPNYRMRWCTRAIKIDPCVEYFRGLDEPAVLCVGLRADEDERQGLYDEEIPARFPLREWGWGLDEVLGYLESKEVTIPPRTDCARCFWQRIGEWYRLWQEHPWIFEDAVQQEERYEHSFRTPGKDSWPVRLKEMREAFQMGRVPVEAKKKKAAKSQGSLWGMDRLGVEEYHGCRVCSL